jgi:hypothetical protein
MSSRTEKVVCRAGCNFCEFLDSEFFNISKYAGTVKIFAVMNFIIWSTLFTTAQVHCVSSTSNWLRSVICIQPMGSAFRFHVPVA